MGGWVRYGMSSLGKSGPAEILGHFGSEKYPFFFGNLAHDGKTLYAIDHVGGQVLAFDPKADHKIVANVQGVAAGSVAACAYKGGLAFANSDGSVQLIAEVKEGGAKLTVAQGLGKPRDITALGEELFVTDEKGGRVVAVTPKGRWVGCKEDFLWAEGVIRNSYDK